MLKFMKKTITNIMAICVISNVAFFCLNESMNLMH